MSRVHTIYLKTGEKFKGDPIPGSKTYYLENRDLFKQSFNTQEFSNEALNELNYYLPKCFKKHYGKNPRDVVIDLGWCYDTDKQKFYNKEYLNGDGKYIYFDVGVLTWNSNKYLVPLSKHGHLDPFGICWHYDSVSTICNLERNKKLDFWNCRKGKRMAKYIEYRKIREKKAKMFLM
jgi:hypothetical protein